MMHRLWQCPCNPTSAISGLIAKLRMRALRRIRFFSGLLGARLCPRNIGHGGKL